MRWKVGKYDLKSNGIRVYHFYDSSDAINICGMGCRVGSAYDPPDAKGMAHKVEHLLFRGTPSDGSHDRVYDMIFRYFGGMEDHNIYTNRTATYYGGPELYRRQYINQVLPVIVDCLKERHLDKRGLDIEKSVILNEYRQTDLDNPESLLDGLFYETMYETNPVRNPIVGNMEQLKQLPQSRFYEFINKHYVSGNMFVIVFGPDRKEAIEVAKKYIDDWPWIGKRDPLDLTAFDRVPVLSTPRIGETKKVGLAQNYVRVGYPTAAYETKDDAALNLIAKVLERRLYDVLREKSKGNDGTYHNPTFSERTLIHGALGAWFATASTDFALYGRDAIISQFSRFREELVPWELFDDARDSLREKFYKSFSISPGEVVEFVINAATNGDPDLKLLHSYGDRLNVLTPRKVRDIANKYFNPDGFVGVILSPAQ